MRRALLILLAVTPIGFATAATAQTSPTVRTSDFVVPDAAEFTVDADWSSMLGTAVNGQVLNCKDGVKNYANIFTLALGVGARLIAGQTVNMNCKPLLKVADTPYSASGTITSDSFGLTNGVFSVTCTLKSNLNVVAQVSLGQSVDGFAQVQVTSSDPLPIACQFTGSGDINGQASTLKGTIEGWAVIGDAASSECAAGETACIPFSLSSSTKVTVTEATGALAGYVGSGTYSYADTFNLSTIVNSVNAIRDRISNLSVSESTPASMNITFSRGSGRAVLLSPAPANGLARGVVSPTSPVVVAAPSGFSCKLQLKAGTKKWTSSSVTSASGSAKFSFTKTALEKITKNTLKVKIDSRPSVSATVTCSRGLAKFSTTPETLKLAKS